MCLKDDRPEALAVLLQAQLAGILRMTVLLAQARLTAVLPVQARSTMASHHPAPLAQALRLARKLRPRMMWATALPLSIRVESVFARRLPMPVALRAAFALQHR